MQNMYSGVVTRLLDRRERLVQTSEEQTPLVIEPLNQRGAEFLREFLSTYSSEIINDIAKHGAVLLRGFDLTSDIDFENSVLSVKDFRGIDRVLMSEAGRTIVDGTRFVLHTNTIVKTGGTRKMGEFHNENYYVTDVPRYISFFCQQSSWLGGETGLVNTANLYSDLPDAMKEKLEQRAYWASVWPLIDMAKRYGVSVDQMEAFCAEAGLPTKIVAGDEAGLPTKIVAGDKVAVMYKPSVVEHPLTKERSLMIHIAGEFQRWGLDGLLCKIFLPDYSGWCWLVHRLGWRFERPRLILWTIASDPREALRILASKIARRRGRPAPRRVRRPFDVRVGDVFTRAETELLAAAMRNRYASFKWKRGDVLMVDNLKMAHGGMPGFGPRKLRALICNPMRLRYSSDGSGVHVVRMGEICESLGAQVVSWRLRIQSQRREPGAIAFTDAWDKARP